MSDANFSQQDFTDYSYLKNRTPIILLKTHPNEELITHNVKLGKFKLLKFKSPTTWTKITSSERPVFQARIEVPLLIDSCTCFLTGSSTFLR